jgi:hypothetical protein
MRVLRAIVQPFVLAMFDGEAHLRPCRAVRTELVRDHHAWRRDGGFQEPPHEPLRRACVSSALDDNVENEAILVDSAPQPMVFARDRDDDFVEVPLVAASGCMLTDPIGECLAEFLPPLTHGLIRHANPARHQQFFDHAQAQGKPKIEPHGIADHLGREAMTAIKKVTGGRHILRLPSGTFQTR